MATKAVTSGSNGVSQVMNQAQPEAANAGGTRKFDVLVYPNAVCKLHFEVIKEKISSGNADMSKWSAKSEWIKEPTILHVTIPSSATQYTFLLQTPKADNYLFYSGSLDSTALELWEDEYSPHKYRNHATHGNVDKARAHPKFKNAAEQTIEIDEVKSLVKEEQKKA